MGKHRKELKEMSQALVNSFPVETNMNRTKYGMSVNKRLKEIRNIRGYSLSKVTNLLAVKGIKTGRSTIQGYEADETMINHRYPSLHMLVALTELYECSFDYIFAVTDEIYRPSDDLIDLLLKNKNASFKGQKITEGQKSLLIEKAREIMSI